MGITIKKGILAAAALVAPTKEVRYYLNGVCVFQRNNIVYVTATDGNSLFIDFLSDAEPADQDFDVIIPIDTVKHALKAKTDNFRLVKQDQDGMWAIGPLAFEPIDGKFPDVLRVIPESTSGEFANFDFERLAIAQKALRLATGLKCGFFHLSNNGEGGVSVMRGESKFPLMLIMPLRSTAVNRYY